MTAYSYLKVGKKAALIFEGTAEIARGSSVRIDGGTLYIGNNFSCNKNCFISCNENVEIGSDVLLGWNIAIRDGDGHTVYPQNSNSHSIKIGDNVWIASFVHIMKGVCIPNGSVIGYGSLCTRKFSEENTLIVGCPAGVKKENIRWER